LDQTRTVFKDGITVELRYTSDGPKLQTVLEQYITNISPLSKPVSAGKIEA